MYRITAKAILTGLLLALFSVPVRAAETPPWVSADASDLPRLHLYFFWSKRCPHCLEALPQIQSLEKRYLWLAVHSSELTQYPENVQLYIKMAGELGEQASSVPAFLFCGQMLVGYDATLAKQLEQQLLTCYKQVSMRWQLGMRQFNLAAAPSSIAVPLLGAIDPQQFSLPTLTILLAALDSFNPCAFFVLLFLLSLLAHARHRGKMLVVGGVFVLFSGLIYFMFMAAWLNLFLWIGHVLWVTYIAGVLAVVMATINIKDYFWPHQAVTLSIPDQAKPGLFSRMRRIVNSSQLASMLGATVVLAIAANSYELLCTAGFPMVYTRLLTLQGLTRSDYYLYLIFYNLVYIVPLLLIVLLFVWTLGARKLQEHEGKRLKLLSGLMMLGLGLMLIFNPALLSNAVFAFTLILASILLTLVIAKFSSAR